MLAMLEESMGRPDAIGASESNRLVEVMFARSLGEATHCCELLRGLDIQAQVEGGAARKACGIAVMVPPDRFIEASEYLALNVQAVADDDDFADDGEEEEDDDSDEFDDDDDDYADDDDDEEEEFGTEDEV
jgi:hypothetical protein